MAANLRAMRPAPPAGPLADVARDEESEPTTDYQAIGAPSRDILYQFLIEALIISGAGAILGIAIALAIPLIARPFLPDGVTIPISGVSIVVAFLVSCVTGMIFGYLPASRAAKLQPTEALRYE